MFKLVLDEEKLGEYKDLPIDHAGISTATYDYLRSYSRPIVSSLFGEKFVPIKILVSIRTDRTNELIVPDNGAFYTDCTATYPNMHPLDDTVMLAAKSLVDRLFDCGDDIIKVIPRTAPLPIGACYTKDTFYVYVNVVVDHTLKTESFFKLKDSHYESIHSLNPRSALELELKNSLALVPNKGGEQ